MKVLEVKNLTKYYGKRKVLDNVSFTLESGKVLGLVGINGAGKSTLLKIIVGLIFPNKGSVIINGYNIKEKFEKAMNYVGSVIENPAMYDYVSGVENLNIIRMMFKNISKERVDEIIKIMSLENYKDKKLKLYSLGMRQRLGIAGALINKPKLLILDEPTNGLDPVGIRDLKNLITHLKKDTSIIISSHILTEIESVCDEVMFIHNGKIMSIEKVDGNKNIENKFFKVLGEEQND